MLIVRPVGPTAGRYHVRGPDPGRWLGAGADALELQGIPSAEELRRLLAGRHPADGAPLGHSHAHRRAGWDLIFAAPKSVSLTAALAPASDSRTIGASHRGAVATTLRWFEQHACWARREGQRVAPGGLVAAVYEHGNSASGDPHLHTHVLVANLVQGADGRWSALDSSALWRDQRTLGALYELALRHELAAHGLRLAWSIDPRGWADVAGVPRQAVEAVSFRRHQVRAEAAVAGPIGGPPATRLGSAPKVIAAGDPAREADTGTAAPRGRRARLAAVRTRAVAATLDWRTRLAATGFGPPEVLELLGAARYPVIADGRLGDAEIARAESWLAERGSSWTRSEAVRALAATLPGGGDPATVTGWVDQLCHRSHLHGPDRWTTALAQSLDQRVLAAGRPRQAARVVVPDHVAAEVLADRPNLSGEARGTVRALVTGSAGVEVLSGTHGRDRFVEQAAILEAARSAWLAAGIGVALDAEEPQLRRWGALCGLDAGKAADSTGVLIVDRADRRASRELATLLGQATEREAKVVLVLGGTAPARRQPRCAALETLAAPHRPLGPELISAPVEAARTALDASGLASGRLVACSSADAALGHLLDRWEASWGDPAGPAQPLSGRPVLVGLGGAEVTLLNRAARARLQAGGLIGPDATSIGGRPFAVGDRVLARSAGASGLPAGSLGTVSAAGPGAALTVTWDRDAGQPGALSDREAGRLAYGYAATPRLAARLPVPALVLGYPTAAGALRGHDALGVAVAVARPRAPGLTDRLWQLAEARAASAEQAVAAGGRQLPPAARAVDGASSLGQLAEERDRLGAILRSSLPPAAPDGGRGLHENHVGYGPRGTARGPVGRDAPAPRPAGVRPPGHDLQRWIEVHAVELDRWRQLGRLMDRRADLVGYSAVVDSAHPARRAAGPEPRDPGQWLLWQRAVREVALHADRWPEGQGSTAPEAAVAFHLSRRRRDHALEQLHQARNRDAPRRRPPERGLYL